MFTGAHEKLVDKCLLTTMLMQLKAAVLVKLFVNIEHIDSRPLTVYKVLTASAFRINYA